MWHRYNTKRIIQTLDNAGCLGADERLNQGCRAATAKWNDSSIITLLSRTLEWEWYGGSGHRAGMGMELGPFLIGMEWAFCPSNCVDLKPNGYPGIAGAVSKSPKKSIFLPNSINNGQSPIFIVFIHCKSRFHKTRGKPLAAVSKHLIVKMKVKDAKSRHL